MKRAPRTTGRPTPVFLLVCLTTVWSTSAWASPSITLLDGAHAISGSATIWEPQSQTDAYSDSSTYDAIGGLPALCGSASPGPDAYAASWADTFFLRVEASSYDGRADAQAEATWQFQPKWRTLELCFNCFLYGEDPTVVELTDQTAGVSVFSYDDPYGPPDYVWGGATMTFAVDPSHVYDLQAMLSAGSYSDGGFYSAIRVAVIPAPSALLLGIFGAALVGRYRRRGIV